MADPFVHAQLIDGQGSRAKIRRGQVVRAVFRRSKILTPGRSSGHGVYGSDPPPLENLSMIASEEVQQEVMYDGVVW